MSYLALLMALVFENFLPERFLVSSRASVDRFNQELEVNLDALGAPGYVYLQWWIPLFAWLLIAYVLYLVLWIISPVAAGLFSVVVMLYGLRFRHFSDVFTNAQLFINQGDFFRARELLLNWMKEYDGTEPVIHRPTELVSQAIYHGTERALRQYFCLMFWFLLVPGPLGVVAYLMVHWSVIRERDVWDLHAFAHEERPTMQQAWRSNKVKTALSPRYVLFVMEWVPARLLALTVGLVSQLDDAVLAWRAAQNQSHFSNRAPLTAVIFNAVGIAGGHVPGDASSGAVSTSPGPVEEAQVLALQQFRQLVLKCAVLWLVVALVVALLGGWPSTTI